MNGTPRRVRLSGHRIDPASAQIDVQDGAIEGQGVVRGERHSLGQSSRHVDDDAAEALQHVFQHEGDPSSRLNDEQSQSIQRGGWLITRP